MKAGPIKIQGTVIDGTGNSNKWFPEILPNLYPGTLNILLETYRPDIEWHTDIKIPTILDCSGKETIVRLGNCLINDIPCFVVKPPLFDYIKRQNWIEIGHKEKLRDFLNLNNGDTVVITFVQNTIKI